jgi:mono/diheme cytochrome c family protein
MSLAMVGAAGALAVAFGAAACAGSNSQRPDPAKIARGQYLVTVGGCNDCHTPL